MIEHTFGDHETAQDWFLVRLSSFYIQLYCHVQIFLRTMFTRGIPNFHWNLSNYLSTIEFDFHILFNYPEEWSWFNISSDIITVNVLMRQHGIHNWEWKNISFVQIDMQVFVNDRWKSEIYMLESLELNHAVKYNHIYVWLLNKSYECISINV